MNIPVFIVRITNDTHLVTGAILLQNFLNQFALLLHDLPLSPHAPPLLHRRLWTSRLQLRNAKRLQCLSVFIHASLHFLQRFCHSVKPLLLFFRCARTMTISSTISISILISAEAKDVSGEEGARAWRCEKKLQEIIKHIDGSILQEGEQVPGGHTKWKKRVEGRETSLLVSLLKKHYPCCSFVCVCVCVAELTPAILYPTKHNTARQATHPRARGAYEKFHSCQEDCDENEREKETKGMSIIKPTDRK